MRLNIYPPASIPIFVVLFTLLGEISLVAEVTKQILNGVSKGRSPQTIPLHAV